MYIGSNSLISTKNTCSLSGVPDFFDRNKILSGGDLSYYQVPHCIRVFFYFVWFVFIHHNFLFYFDYVPIVTFWIFTYHKIWILLIIFCFIWNYLGGGGCRGGWEGVGGVGVNDITLSPVQRARLHSKSWWRRPVASYKVYHYSHDEDV